MKTLINKFKAGIINIYETNMKAILIIIGLETLIILLHIIF